MEILRVFFMFIGIAVVFGALAYAIIVFVGKLCEFKNAVENMDYLRKRIEKVEKAHNEHGLRIAELEAKQRINSPENSDICDPDMSCFDSMARYRAYVDKKNKEE